MDSEEAETSQKSQFMLYQESIIRPFTASQGFASFLENTGNSGHPYGGEHNSTLTNLIMYESQYVNSPFLQSRQPHYYEDNTLNREDDAGSEQSEDPLSNFILKFVDIFNPKIRAMQREQFTTLHQYARNNNNLAEKKQDLLEYSISDSEKQIYDSQKYMTSSGQKSELSMAKKFSILTFNNNGLQSSHHPNSESSLLSFNAASIQKKCKDYPTTSVSNLKTINNIGFSVLKPLMVIDRCLMGQMKQEKEKQKSSNLINLQPDSSNPFLIPDQHQQTIQPIIFMKTLPNPEQIQDIKLKNRMIPEINSRPSSHFYPNNASPKPQTPNIRPVSHRIQDFRYQQPRQPNYLIRQQNPIQNNNINNQHPVVDHSGQSIKITYNHHNKNHDAPTGLRVRSQNKTNQPYFQQIKCKSPTNTSDQAQILNMVRNQYYYVNDHQQIISSPAAISNCHQTTHRSAPSSPMIIRGILSPSPAHGLRNNPHNFIRSPPQQQRVINNTPSQLSITSHTNRVLSPHTQQQHSSYGLKSYELTHIKNFQQASNSFNMRTRQQSNLSSKPSSSRLDTHTNSSPSNFFRSPHRKQTTIQNPCSKVENEYYGVSRKKIKIISTIRKQQVV